jgi:citrate synthase
VYDRVNIDSAINMRSGQWLAAADAATLLGISRATLYAYVSRGFVRSQAAPGLSRERRYSRDDLERLRRRSEERRDPGKAAARALHWGPPVLESAITLIDGQRLYYRGHDVLALARTRSVEQVASLIWTDAFDWPRPTAAAAARDLRGEFALPFAARTQSLLAKASGFDAAASDLRPASVAACGWRILQLMVAAAAPPRDAPERSLTVDQQLARAWRIGPRSADLLRSALILCADHELNVSSFTARSVASAGADPYAVVIAGLSALAGPKHGGAGARVEAMLRSLRGEPHLRSAIAARLRRGEPIDGFGHPLYPGGDPRAATLITMLRERHAGSAELRFVLAVERQVSALIREKPNLDFALAALARMLRLPAGSPLVLFAIGRTIGWIGHAIEQYATDQLVRPRAKYVGIAPPLDSPDERAQPAAAHQSSARGNATSRNPGG